ncbi:MAG: prepilin-type cleavage/methylation domain-containing protein [Planctomycetota bacterium]
MRGFSLLQAVVLLAALLVAAVLLLPVLGKVRHSARETQNMTQLRGIHQGFVVFSQSCGSGSADGYFAGVSATGLALIDIENNVIEANTFGQSNDIRGYDRSRDGDIDPDEMNDPETGEGFVQYAFAELLTGDFIPAGSSDYFLNPADTIKAAFVPGDPGDAGRFDMSKVSYTVAGVATAPLVEEWRETINADAIALADRAVGDGDTFGQSGSTASSVWTEAGSGRWRGAITRNDSSTRTHTGHAYPNADLNYGGIEFEGGDVLNLFARPAAEDLELTDDGKIRKGQGVLFDQDEAGRATGI